MKPTTHTSILLFIALSLFCFTGFAQDEDIEKKTAKADKLIGDLKFDDAEKVMTELVKKYPASGKAWDALAGIQLKVLDNKESMDGLFNNLTITSKDKNGNVVKDDTLGAALIKLMQSIKPSDTYKRHMVNTYRWACVQTRQAYYPSMITRMYLVDPDFNKEVKADAKKEFYKAEQEFEKKNFNAAAKLYQKAIDLDPTFYKARLYLGDVYYFTKHYDLPTQEFKDAIASQPEMLEPRKYLFDALMESNEFVKAYKVGIAALMKYPDFSMMAKVQSAAYQAGIKCDMHWQKRDVLPNTVKEIGRAHV